MYVRNLRQGCFDSSAASFIGPLGGSAAAMGWGEPRRRGGRFGGAAGPGRGRRVRRGQLRESVLRLLADQPLNGYQIMTTLAERTCEVWQPSPGAIYPCLSQLEDEGLITATEADGQKVYTLTEAGQAAAEQVAAEPWAGSWPGDNPAQAAMLEQFRNLVHTWRFANQTASPEQMTAIAGQLETTRKTILTILAEAK